MRAAGSLLLDFAGRLRSSRFWRDERGVSATDYGLMLAGLACVILAAMALVGARVANRFDFIANVLQSS